MKLKKIITIGVFDFTEKDGEITICCNQDEATKYITPSCIEKAKQIYSNKYDVDKSKIKLTHYF